MMRMGLNGSTLFLEIQVIRKLSGLKAHIYFQPLNCTCMLLIYQKEQILKITYLVLYVNRVLYV